MRLTSCTPDALVCPDVAEPATDWRLVVVQALLVLLVVAAGGALANRRRRRPARPRRRVLISADGYLVPDGQRARRGSARTL